MLTILIHFFSFFFFHQYNSFQKNDFNVTAKWEGRFEEEERSDSVQPNFFPTDESLGSHTGGRESGCRLFAKCCERPRQRHNFRDLRDISRAPVNHQQSFTRFHGIRSVERIPFANFFVSSLSFFQSPFFLHVSTGDSWHEAYSHPPKFH